VEKRLRVRRDDGACGGGSAGNTRAQRGAGASLVGGSTREERARGGVRRANALLGQESAHQGGTATVAQPLGAAALAQPQGAAAAFATASIASAERNSKCRKR
jgi:hypothetical protein